MKIIGIDLGTTNSAVSVYEMGASRTIQLKGGMTTPSIIWVNPDGEYIVGKEAKQHVAVDPSHILISTKRDLGSSTVYNINGEVFTPTEAATIILAYLKREAKETLGEEVNDAVITVPAYFGFQEIGEVKKAAIDAGLNPVAIIPEPTAAAIRYGMEMDAPHQNICVVDLGGGTFDVTLLEVKFDRRLHKHIISPVNWDGDHYLGGDDFDNAIIDWMIQNGAKGYKNKLELKALAEMAKIDLAGLSETEISHPVYLPEPIVLTLNQYTRLIQDKLDQIGKTIKKTITESVVEGRNMEVDDINRFILVGGSCKHPVVKDYVKSIIGREPYSASNLDSFVADGAALYHHALTTPTSSLSVDDAMKLPKTLGTDLMVNGEKINAVLLEKGVRIPCRAIQVATVDAKAPLLRSFVIEGEQRLFDDNKSIDVIEIPLENTGYLHPIITEFNLDASSLLSFNTYVVNLDDSNKDLIVDDLEALFQSAEGDVNIINNNDWDRFYAKYSAYIKKTPKPLKLNEK